MARWIKLIMRFLVAFLHVLSSRMEARYMQLYLPEQKHERVDASGVILALLLILVVLIVLWVRI